MCLELLFFLLNFVKCLVFVLRTSHHCRASTTFTGLHSGLEFKPMDKRTIILPELWVDHIGLVAHPTNGDPLELRFPSGGWCCILALDELA